MTTVRSPAAPRTRDRLLREAARLFAARGFHGTSMDDLGTAIGISGPAVYKHFSNKDEVLSRLLVGISRQLLDGGEAVASGAQDGADALRRLVAFHADFATNEPDLIRVQDRDLASLPEADAHTVRSLQRAYAEVWVTALCDVRPELTRRQARVEVHGLFGLLNSTPHSGTGPATRARLSAMALRALGLPAPV
jgi:AcrR family transcriptional regulator